MQNNDNKGKLDNCIRTKMEVYRNQLLAANMQEPKKRGLEGYHWIFFKPMTSLTAFIVNLRGQKNGIDIVYGYASTAFTRMAGDENALIDWGVDDKDITIREMVHIHTVSDEEPAKIRIQQMYERYQQTEKDALLILAKERRKAFIQQIAIRLKPLGFKKKANSWKYELTGEYYLMFNLQKSMYSDQYYFNIYIGKDGTNHYGDCFYTRLAPCRQSPADWQLLSHDEWLCFLDHELVPVLQRIIQTPLEIQGRDPSFWKNCFCKREKCAHCWVEKNLWEANEHQQRCCP